jgi:hypothetical protein
MDRQPGTTGIYATVLSRLEGGSQSLVVADSTLIVYGGQPGEQALMDVLPAWTIPMERHVFIGSPSPNPIIAGCTPA